MYRTHRYLLDKLKVKLWKKRQLHLAKDKENLTPHCPQGKRITNLDRSFIRCKPLTSRHRVFARRTKILMDEENNIIFKNVYFAAQGVN